MHRIAVVVAVFKRVARGLLHLKHLLERALVQGPVAVTASEHLFHWHGLHTLTKPLIICARRLNKHPLHCTELRLGEHCLLEHYERGLVHMLVPKK